MTTITNPTDLLSAVPFLIGYQPIDSIVLIALEDEAISFALRIDFPTELDASATNDLINRFGAAKEVLMISYIPDNCSDANRVLEPLIEQLGEAEITIRESIIVVAGR